MAEIKDKIITVESLGVVKDAMDVYNQETYMTKSNPTGTGTLTMDGDGNFSGTVTTNSLKIGETMLEYDEKDDALNINSHIILQNNVDIFGVRPGDNDAYSLISMSIEGNTIIGHHGYVNGDSDTNIYGADVHFGIASASKVLYRPYYRSGDTLTMTIHTNGYIPNSYKDLYFYLPLSKPVIGSPTITITSNNGMLLRQNGKYTHGSSGSPITYVKPDSYSATGNTNWNGICIKATFSSNTIDATNNSPIAVYWDGTITFS